MYLLKMYVRELVGRNKFLLKIYKKMSQIKTDARKNLDDITFYKKRSKENTGKDIDLINPKTFQEKVLWLQMHDRREIYTTLTDKVLSKEWVAEKIGEEHTVKTIGVWDNVEDIPFDELPDKCVLKCNHDCGSVYIKREGEPFDIRKIKKNFGIALRRNYYDVGRVWGYKNIIPKVFCEEFIDAAKGTVPWDYKIFCFDGEPKFIQLVMDRDKDYKATVYDVDWNYIPVRQEGHDFSKVLVEKPKCLGEMLDIARVLSKGFPHVRVDLYLKQDGTIVVGEMTFCESSGTLLFYPDEYNYIFGAYLDLEGVEDDVKGVC